MNKLLVLGALALSAMSACRGSDRLYLRGRVLSGVSAAPVPNYSLVVELKKEKLTADVKDGEYVVGPIPAYQDFSVVIKADGYRDFRAEVGGDATPKTGSDAREFTAYREAVMYPNDVVTPASTVRVFLSNSQAQPTGYVRLRPTGDANQLQVDFTQGPAGSSSVSSVVLTNTADAQSAVIIKPLQNGSAAFAEGELIYGVTYHVDVFGVQGYNFATSENNDIVAGAQDAFFLTISPISNKNPTLSKVYLNTDNNALIADGSFVVGFNLPVDFSQTKTQAAMTKILDRDIEIDIVAVGGTYDGTTAPLSAGVSGNPDGDSQQTHMKANNDPDDNAHGVNMSIDESGLTLTLKWGNQSAFDAFDNAGEALYITHWKSLDSVVLKPKSATGSGEDMKLSQLIEPTGHNRHNRHSRNKR